jgi:hypothetical protein
MKAAESKSLDPEILSPRKTECILLAVALSAPFPGSDLDDFDDRMAIFVNENPPKNPTPLVIENLFPSALGERRPPSKKQIEKAEALVLHWRRLNVRVIAVQSVEKTDRRRVYFAAGDVEALIHSRTAVVNSRRPRELTPGTTWAEVTRAMTVHEGRQDRTLVSGLGNYAYELVCHLAKRHTFPLIAVCDGPLPIMETPAKRSRFFRTYGSLLPPKQCLLISPFPPGWKCPGKSALGVRDRTVFHLADRILAAEINPDGNMFDLLSARISAGHSTRVWRPAGVGVQAEGNLRLLDCGAKPFVFDLKNYLPSAPKVHSRAPLTNLDIQDMSKCRWLIHFTKTWRGPWPGQNKNDFYRSIMDNEPGAGHLAIDSLIRILTEMQIRAGNRIIRGGHAVVSFTACDWDRLSELFLWRPALGRPTMEPYGIAVEKQFLFEMGARPAVYGGDDAWRRLPKEQKYRFQASGPSESPWSREREWRLAGDLDLRRVPQDRCLILAPTRFEAERAQAATNFPVMVLNEITTTK